MKCNICGGTEFGAGPNGRMAKTNLPPHCHACGSLERHRIVRRIFQSFPIGYLDQRYALKFGPMNGLDVRWFQNAEIVSRDSANEIDLQAVVPPDAKYDFIAVNHILEFIDDDRAVLRELLCILGPHGLLEIGFSNPMSRETSQDFPPSAENHAVRHLYGRDVLIHFADIFQGLTVLVVEESDPCTNVHEHIHLFFRDAGEANLACQWLKLGGSSAVQVIDLPTIDVIPLPLPAVPPHAIEHELQGLPVMPPSDPFESLREEFSLWQADGRTCQFWWRDDDLVAISPLLTQMSTLAKQFHVEVLVAVIPFQAEDNLAINTQEMSHLVFCQHGFNHKNYEPIGSPNGEFGPNRPLDEIEQDIWEGQTRMQQLFGERFFPVFVPPWNRLQEKAQPILLRLNFIGLSQHADQIRAESEGLRLINTHVDIMQWASSPNIICHPTADLVRRLIALLRHRRLQPDIAHEPIGILSHHRVMREDAWQFMASLLSVTREFSCVQWLTPRDVFSAPNQKAATTTQISS